MANSHEGVNHASSRLYSDEFQRIGEYTLSPNEENAEMLARFVRLGLDRLETRNAIEPELRSPRWPDLADQGVPPDAAMDEALRMLSGQPKWHHPFVAHNINPSPLLNSVAASSIASAFNGNALWDFVSGHALQLEQHIVQQMAAMAGLTKSRAGGAFTYGGRGCMTYAVRLGLNRCVRGVSSQGLRKERLPVVLSSKINHYSVEHVCSVLGLGSSSAVRIGNDQSGKLDLEEFRRAFRKAIANGNGIAAVIASGGNAMDVAMDPLQEMQAIIDAECKAAALPYRPFVYFDTVVGWAWMSFFGYDFENNPLGIPRDELAAIASMVQRLQAIASADGFGCDFHKTGLAPINSSCFIAKDGAEFQSLLKDEVANVDWQPHGNNFVHSHTLEHTRPTGPIAAAWTSMRTIGKTGLQSYLARLMELSRRFKGELTNAGFEVVNQSAHGFSTTIYPSSLSAAPTYEQLIALSAAEVEESNRFVFRLFDNLAYPEDGKDPIFLRYLPQARTSQSGIPAGALVIYPMSIHTTDEQVTLISARIQEVYQQLMRGAGRKALRFTPPAHVPR